MSSIEHVFVLMLENRSFDHFFGLSGRAGVPQPPAPFAAGAADRAPGDPAHEFLDVQQQLQGRFDQKIGACKGFAAGQIPVLSQLADEFVLFDNWFSSLPGPTWPNRFFVHAASSGGLCTSPSGFQSTGAVIWPKSPFRFQNGTVFDRLDAAIKKPRQAWRVYHGDVHPQVLALPGMVKRYLSGGDEFRPLMPGSAHGAGDLRSDLSEPGYAPAYTFIEPDYAINLFRQFYDGDSQHPRGLVSAGEQLIKYVYESIRQSPIWPKSALLITWDEHGGFYDHVTPPAATPPGDAPLNQAHGANVPTFDFAQFGFRVPTLLISPQAPKGVLGSTLFPQQRFDHSSVIASLRELFQLGAPLTRRDQAAPSFVSALQPTARASAQVAPAQLHAPAPRLAALEQLALPSQLSAQKDVDGFLAGVGLIALDMDRAMAQATKKPSIASFQPQSLKQFQAARAASLKSPDFPAQLVQYINEVGVRAQAHRARNMLRARRKSQA